MTRRRINVTFIILILLFCSTCWSQVSKVEFQRATLNGNIEIVQAGLKEKGYEYVRLRDKEENTPLHLACCALKGGEKAEIISLLLRHGADVNATNKHYSLPLHIAVSTNNLKGTELLLKERSILVNERSSANLTPLLYALRNRFEEMISLLLSHPGVNPNTGSSDGMTPLHYAAKWGYIKEAKLLLKDSRTNPHQKQMHGDFVGAIPLHYAAMQAQPEAMEFFLNQKGVEVNLPIEEGLYAGFTPLHFVVMNPDTIRVFEILKLLLNAGANFKQKTKSGKLPSDLTSVHVILEFLKDPNPTYELKKRNN